MILKNNNIFFFFIYIINKINKKLKPMKIKYKYKKYKKYIITRNTSMNFYKFCSSSFLAISTISFPID